ncbi:MAG: GNAT family N-acetyltransferase [Gammaproteobacteria bacterium]|jgi:ribosomal protein S18 acetylase RimI-like enzyme|nr:GNAT family N-acetyltransferase [Gammaproteobacteria bacterium]MBT5203157.1 GNAT family N-acetyltransferase [Gammaproteobacteria bacterium]MBT5602875.1 GNAT family N-acetyltransferase [Gammaproteobacteria bacterium]MBT6247152.1 GNAT family N-acetyltransferase [Gammaproteobacteria bacterium]
MPPASIRIARHTDAPTLHAMVLELAESSGEKNKVTSSAEDFLQYGFADQPAFEGLIAEYQGEAVGLSLFFYNFSTWRGKLGAYIQDLYVKPPHRGTGLGRQLIIETARCARQRGADHLRLSVDSDNKSAQHFYQHLGITWREQEQLYQADGEAFRKIAEAGN